MKLSWRENLDWRRWSLGWPRRWKKKEKQGWRRMVATKRHKLAMETDEERKARLDKMVVYHTAQVDPGNRGRKKSKNGLDIIWIEIKVKKIIQGMSSLTL